MSLYLIILSVILALASIILLFFSYRQLRLLGGLRKLMSEGEQPDNLEKILSVMAGKIKKLETSTNLLLENQNLHRELLGLAVQKVGYHKFNALADEGGNLSFTLALLNEHDTGVVITTLNNRTQTRIYLKNITGGDSNIPITPEEREALVSAQTQHKK